MLTPKTRMKTERKSEILEVRHAGLNAYGDEHQVVSVKSPGSAIHRKKPCPNCPWRVDAVGEFSAEAFRHSAETAYDMSNKIFACHEAGIQRTAIFAGFLLRGADHNLAIRLKYLQGHQLDATCDGVELHDSYRAMAIANGVPADDPVLAPCR